MTNDTAGVERAVKALRDSLTHLVDHGAIQLGTPASKNLRELYT
jgi:hypothetical protein